MKKNLVANAVLVEAASVASRVREIREDIHAHPELRFQEFRTSEICAVELEALGIEVRRGVGGTGVVGLLRGSNRSLDGRTVGFRAEMDALAMDDLCDRPYASTTPGVAHLCGHDGHVAALLGTAIVLSRLRENLNGNVKFFFEPAEESGVLDDVSGAARMIADGALNDPRPNAIFGGHFYPDWPAGSIALRPGASFSGNDTMKLTVIGRESHSAMPNTGIDAIVVAAHVITAMQSMAAREIDVGEAASFTIGTIRGGRAANLLAERVEMNATIRISDENLRDSLPAKLERVVRGVCEAFGATYELEYKLRNLPPVVSTVPEVKIMSAAVKEVLGDDQVIPMRHPRLAADTMQNWLEHAPGVFFMVGTSNSDPATHFPSHHQRFDIAPETWKAVVAAEAITAIRYLESNL